MKKFMAILLISAMCFGCAVNHSAVKTDMAVEQPADNITTPIRALTFLLFSI